MGRIGITCYPSIGGSGILACALGEELAHRGHDVHFISYERPVRIPETADNVHFHPVAISDYSLFRHPDYTLPLSVQMAQVASEHRLDVLHVHYAVPHATAALLARAMLLDSGRPAPRIVTTLHGTDTTLLGRDPLYAPAIRYALDQSDVVTAVSAYLRDETLRLIQPTRPVEVVPNFFAPKRPSRSRADVRAELGVGPEECLIVHSSNLRGLKRLDLLWQALGDLPANAPYKLLVLAGADFSPQMPAVRAAGLEGRIVVRERVTDIEDYLQACDLSLYTSESESFCLGILEAMAFGCPAAAFAVGGIPELVESGTTGFLAPFGAVAPLSDRVAQLIADPELRRGWGRAAQQRAATLFSAERIVPEYERLYGF